MVSEPEGGRRLGKVEKKKPEKETSGSSERAQGKGEVGGHLGGHKYESCQKDSNSVGAETQGGKG